MSKISGVSVKTLSGSKKGQGLSLNTIIIAIIVLIVLVVLVMIFTGYFGKIVTPSLKSCTAAGGQCATQCNVGQLGSEKSGVDCPDKTMKCCESVQTQFNDRPENSATCETQGGTCYDGKDFGCGSTLPAGVNKGACCTASTPCTTFTVTSCKAWEKNPASGPCTGGKVCCTV